jgi:hypothetical protein
MANITLELPNELAQHLEREAARQGLDPARYILTALESSLQPVSILLPTEGDLLQVINLGLSQEAWRSYRILIAKRRAESLMPEEHQLLIQFSTQLEQLSVQRTQALIQLATLRQQSLSFVMESLGLSLSPNLLDEDEEGSGDSV